MKTEFRGVTLTSYLSCTRLCSIPSWKNWIFIFFQFYFWLQEPKRILTHPSLWILSNTSLPKIKLRITIDTLYHNIGKHKTWALSYTHVCVCLHESFQLYRVVSCVRISPRLCISFPHTTALHVSNMIIYITSHYSNKKFVKDFFCFLLRILWACYARNMGEYHIPWCQNILTVSSHGTAVWLAGTCQTFMIALITSPGWGTCELLHSHPNYEY